MRSRILCSAIFLLGIQSKVVAQSQWAKTDAYAFPTQQFSDRQGPRTNSLLISVDDVVEVERYDRGFGPQKKHILWSISKSLTSLLFARAEMQGLVHRDESICHAKAGLLAYLKDQSSKHCQIRFKDLIHWTSGLRWVEEYENTRDVRVSSVIAMLYGQGRRDTAAFVLEHPSVAPAGKVWRYSSGDTAVLSAALKNIFSASSGAAAMGQHLFGPLGISDYTVEEDGVGHAMGASFNYLRPKDLLKIGQVLLQEFAFPGKFFPNDWTSFILQVPQAFKEARLDHDSHNIGGGGFWLNKADGTGLKRPWPAAPDDTFVARGHWGQFLIVIPSQRLVAVRTGDTRDKSFQLHKFIEVLMEDMRNRKMVAALDPQTVDRQRGGK